jgi:RNA polymerase sigma-70 factor (ECF subfamily)
MSVDRLASAGQVIPAARDRTEVALVKRARSGDQEAFAAIVDSRLTPTFRTVLAILGNESDAKDATQAIFVHAWASLPQLRDPELFPAWFGRIVVNTSRSALRGRRRRSIREIPASVIADDGGSHGSTNGHEDRTASLDRLERALDRIAPDERTILWLHHYEGLSLADVGDRLGIPPGTVKSRLFTARRALERALQVQDR